jgi:hypothetical protein
MTLPELLKLGTEAADAATAQPFEAGQARRCYSAALTNAMDLAPLSIIDLARLTSLPPWRVTALKYGRASPIRREAFLLWFALASNGHRRAVWRSWAIYKG